MFNKKVSSMQGACFDRFTDHMRTNIMHLDDRILANIDAWFIGRHSIDNNNNTGAVATTKV
jgi:hypothetical protein